MKREEGHSSLCLYEIPDSGVVSPEHCLHCCKYCKAIMRNDTLFDLSEGILTLAASLILSSLLQFMLNVTFASLLIHSLRRHMWKMKRNTTSFWNPQMEAHMGAMRLMICFLLLYVPYSIAALLYFPSYARKNLRVQVVCMIITAAYSPGHSVLIIITHHKLKAKAKKIFCIYK
ncbi:taste receptor type 2 member 14 [Sigmodon hispidus]